MLALRFYIDKKIDPDSKLGGEHSRVLDTRELDESRANDLVSAQLFPDENIDQMVTIIIDDPEGWVFI